MLVDIAVLVLLEFCVLGLPFLPPKFSVHVIPVMWLHVVQHRRGHTPDFLNLPTANSMGTILYMCSETVMSVGKVAPASVEYGAEVS